MKVYIFEALNDAAYSERRIINIFSNKERAIKEAELFAEADALEKDYKLKRQTALQNCVAWWTYGFNMVTVTERTVIE